MICPHCLRQDPGGSAGKSCIYCGQILQEETNVNLPLTDGAVTGQARAVLPRDVLRLRCVLGWLWTVLSVCLLGSGAMPFSPLSDTGHVSGYGTLFYLIQSGNERYIAIVSLLLMVPTSVAALATGVRWILNSRSKSERNHFVSALPMLIEGGLALIGTVAYDTVAVAEAGLSGIMTLGDGLVTSTALALGMLVYGIHCFCWTYRLKRRYGIQTGWHTGVHTIN